MYVWLGSYYTKPLCYHRIQSCKHTHTHTCDGVTKPIVLQSLTALPSAPYPHAAIFHPYYIKLSASCYARDSTVLCSRNEKRNKLQLLHLSS